MGKGAPCTAGAGHDQQPALPVPHDCTGGHRGARSRRQPRRAVQSDAARRHFLLQGPGWLLPLLDFYSAITLYWLLILHNCWLLFLLGFSSATTLLLTVTPVGSLQCYYVIISCYICWVSQPVRLLHYWQLSLMGLFCGVTSFFCFNGGGSLQCSATEVQLSWQGIVEI